MGEYWVSLITAMNLVSAKEYADQETAYICTGSSYGHSIWNRGVAEC